MAVLGVYVINSDPKFLPRGVVPAVHLFNHIIIKKINCYAIALFRLADILLYFY